MATPREQADALINKTLVGIGLRDKAVAPYDPHATDGQTLAKIIVDDRDGRGTYEVPNIKQFTYTSDILTLGDPFSVVVPDPRGQYKGRLRPGATIKLKLQNPNVAGGAECLKMTGVIRQRSVRVDPRGGTSITLGCADLGWHLQTSDVPYWKNLKGRRVRDLLDLCLDDSWGFEGLRLENDTNRALKLGRQGALIALRPKLALNVADVIETAVGEKPADLLTLYARRLGLLVNVSADGYLQTFAPNYDQDPVYRIDHHPLEKAESSRNNVKSVEWAESCDETFTETHCVSQSIYTPQQATASRVTYDKEGDSVNGGNIHAGALIGKHTASDALPFAHRRFFSDGEMLSQAWVNYRAEWGYQRGLFNGWQYRVKVRGHFQSGRWWEPDTMVSVDDTVLDVVDNYYVQSVTYTRDEQGDCADVLIRKANLLGA